MTGAATPPVGSLTRTVVRGVGIVGGGQLTTQALTFTAYVVLARLAPPTTFGTFAAASVLVTFSSLLIESGMSSALIHRRQRMDEAAATAFVATVLGGLLFTALSFAAAPLLGWYFGSGEITQIALASAPIHLVTSVGVVPNALLQRELAFARRAVVEPGAVIALGVGSAAGLAAGYGAWGLLLGAYASAVVRVLLLWLVSSWRPALQLASVRTWRELAAYGRHILGAELLREGNRVTLTALIGRFAGTADLGQYNFGSRIATQTNALFVSTGAAVLFPVLSRIATDAERFRSAFLRSLRAISLVAVPGVLIYLGVGRQLVIVLLGQRWHVAGDVLVALSGLGLGGALTSVGGETLKAAGRPQFAFRMQLLAAVMTVSLTAALLPVSIVAAAAGVSIASVVVGGYAIWAAADVVGLPRADVVAEVWPPVLGGLVAAAAAAAADRFLDAAHDGTLLGALSVAGEVSFGVLVYLVVLRVVAPQRAANLGLVVRSGLRRRP
jgi:O-antigen/teichoic acid export membrane protein